jgi:predicted alpha-1,2-mannosidase
MMHFGSSFFCANRPARVIGLLFFLPAFAGLVSARSFAASTTAETTSSLTRYVNPFIGTAPGNPTAGFKAASGAVFPGAVFPRGMLQWSPDTTSDLPGGYHHPDNKIKGFSVRHFSGRGCTAWQDFAFMPVPGGIEQPPSKTNGFHGATFAHANEVASPGYYRVRLDNGLQVELTATLRTGMARFTFPEGAPATLLVDGGSSITGTNADTSIAIIGEDRIQGRATAEVGCGKELYTIYFSTRFNRPFRTFATWNGQTITASSRTSTGEHVGAVLTFDPANERTVEAKVGISFVSVENAIENLDAENRGWDFNAIRAGADTAWNNVMMKIIIEGGTVAQRETFYTALYHCFLHPNVFNDANGEYRGMDRQVHRVANGRLQYENIPGWDSYRSTTPLTALIAPAETSDIMQSLVTYAAQGGGGLPRWQQANRNSGGMTGDGPVLMLASAHAFGARNFDTAAALEAMDRNAGKVDTTSDGHLVRPNLAEYIRLGYVPRYVAMTLEYASADFALSQFAAALGDTTKAAHYLTRSGSWKNLYNPASGYIQQRLADGSWVPGVGPDTHQGYTEGTAAQYTWMVPFDLKGLFERMGGKARAISRLDEFFVKLNEGGNGDRRYANMGNEPCEAAPWAYVYAGAPAKAQEVVRRIQNELFSNKPNGLPGNDDAGALSSWYVFSALGLYPSVPGVCGFVLGTPLFPRAVVHLENGGSLSIEGANASPDNRYVQSLTINNTPTTRPWLQFETIRRGGTLVYGLGNRPSKWGTAPTDAPPSFGLNER